jgi:hypothetical protein
MMERMTGKRRKEERDRRNECVVWDSGRNRRRGGRLLDWRVKEKEKRKDRRKGRE